MKRAKLLVSSMILLLFFTTVAGATLIDPGTKLNAVPAGTETGTLVATVSGSYNTITTVKGKDIGIAGAVVEAVYSEDSTTSSVCAVGHTCLDFVYQFTETNPNSGVTSFAASDFDNIVDWKTDLSQSSTKANSLAISLFTAVTGKNPNSTDAQRGNNGPDTVAADGGGTVTFVMADGGGTATDSTHELESYILIIKTDAPKYVPGSVSLLSNHTATSFVGTGNPSPWIDAYCMGCPGVQGFMPGISNSNVLPAFALNGTGYFNTFLAPIPEPGFYGVLAIALAGLFVAVKYRRNKQTA